MKAIGKYLLIRKEKEDNVKNGLIIEEDNEIRYVKAEVLDVGDDIKEILKKGDKIKFDRHATKNGVDVDGELLHVITINDVVLVL